MEPKQPAANLAAASAGEPEEDEADEETEAAEDVAVVSFARPAAAAPHEVGCSARSRSRRPRQPRCSWSRAASAAGRRGRPTHRCCSPSGSVPADGGWPSLCSSKGVL